MTADSVKRLSPSFDAYRRSGGIFLWFLQRLSGLVLLGMLFSHFYFLHYDRSGFITYDKVAARLASPSWKVFDLLFLTVALFHGMNGLWTAGIEYIHKAPVRKIFLVLLLAIGFSVLIIGSGAITLFKVKP